MDTKFIKLPDPEGMRMAGRVIREGGLVAFPTETVYGLGGDAFDPEASAKIYAAKGRPSDNPLIVHIADMESLERLSSEIPEQLYALADSFWPGPLTMIVKKRPEVPDRTTGGLDTVAIRMPDHPAALELIREAGGYIAAPSANASGRPSPTLASHVLEDLGGRIEVILDGGEVGIGVESTIVDLTGEKIQILRPGYVTAQMLERVVGHVELDPAIAGPPAAGVRPKAPGMMYRHYAPKGDMMIVRGEGAADYICQKLGECSGKAAVLCCDESRDRYPAEKAVIKSLGSLQRPEEAALKLYRVLRELDSEGVSLIYSESFPDTGIGEALMNRMMKAAGYKVIEA
ncbi:MAG: threonylcarbamoyl-AMP synthase [Lachnospiraceae bacterium]|nr:threonylcarbamoyl-AMP synthase [Lachnospiraceae bacterium]